MQIASQQDVYTTVSSMLADATPTVNLALLGESNNIDYTNEVRWFAPECTRDGVFSVKSDVWSAAVLFYEVGF